MAGASLLVLCAASAGCSSSLGDREVAERCVPVLQEAYPTVVGIYVNVGLYADPTLGEGLVVLSDGSGATVGLTLDRGPGGEPCVLAGSFAIDEISVREQLAVQSFLVAFHIDPVAEHARQVDGGGWSVTVDWSTVVVL